MSSSDVLLPSEGGSNVPFYFSVAVTEEERARRFDI